MRVYHVNINQGCNPFYFLPRPVMVMAAPVAPKTVFEYSLKAVENALVFQVTEQSKDITNFLKTNRFQASNGMIIAGDRYPELKDSTNHVYLRGSDESRDLKLDVTRFVGNMQRDSKKSLVEAAIKEFVAFIAKQTKASYYNRVW